MEKYGRSPVKDYLAVARYAGDKDFEIGQPEARELRKRFEPIEQRAGMPTEAEIRDILREMGKFKPSQELNCGSCGYDTCREKAIAIYQGKAEISMCLPYLMEKAENVNDTIARNSPNGIIMLNDQLEVQQINPAAQPVRQHDDCGTVFLLHDLHMVSAQLFPRVVDALVADIARQIIHR